MVKFRCKWCGARGKKWYNHGVRSGPTIMVKHHDACTRYKRKHKYVREAQK
jgi:hypothetical protein